MIKVHLQDMESSSKTDKLYIKVNGDRAGCMDGANSSFCLLNPIRRGLSLRSMAISGAVSSMAQPCAFSTLESGLWARCVRAKSSTRALLWHRKASSRDTGKRVV